MNILKLLLPLLALSCLSCSTFLFLQAQPFTETIDNISYHSDSSQSAHLLDLYLPKNKNDFPVIVFVHGGDWKDQDKNYFHWAVGLYNNVGYAMAQRGIGTAVINYRLSPEVNIEGQLQDIITATKWVKDNIGQYRGSPHKLFLSGHSAGGHLVALLGMDNHYLFEAGFNKEDIKGFMPLSAIYDVFDMSLRSKPEYNQEVTHKVFGSSQSAMEKYSPIKYLSKELPPFFIVVGEKDFVSVAKQTETIVPKMKNLGVDLSFFSIANHSHSDIVLNIGKETDQISDKMADFIFQHL